MFKRYWIIAVVFGLTVGIASGQTNEQAPHPDNETNTQHSQPQIIPIPVPVEIIDNDAAAKARKSQEEESKQREIKDLAAQEGMNAATQKINAATQDMRDYALYSTIFVGIGTVLLIVTLWLTRQANQAARDAVAVTRDIGQAQVRAYLSVGVTAFTDWKDKPRVPIKFKIKIINSGQSPAIDLFFNAKTIIRPYNLPSPCKDLIDIEGRDGGGITVQAGTFAESTFGGVVRPHNIFTANSHKFPFAVGAISYKDVFGNRYKRRFAFLIDMVEDPNKPTLLDGINETIVNLTATAEHNDEKKWNEKTKSWEQ